MSEQGLSNLMHEERHFDPPEEFAKNANVKAEVYEEADRDRPAFWGKQAERISWAEPFTEVLDWSNPPFAKWFVGGKLNAVLQLRRPARRGRQRRQGRLPLGRRARGRHPRRSPTPTSRTRCPRRRTR